jgi:predicted dehydrogenase
MKRLRVGVIGTGSQRKPKDAQGSAMAYLHAAGYLALSDRCELVACADIVPAHAKDFAQATGVPAAGVFTDHKRMLAETMLDVVSICTWPHLHAPLTIDCAMAGVRAVHCEKPMADSWGAAQQMVEVCEQCGVQLTFNHQRRFAVPFRMARALVRDGAIGDLQRVEVSCDNIYDWGTHYIDMCGFYLDDEPAEWVLGQVDTEAPTRIFGVPVERQALGHWRYPSGVFGLIAAGASASMVDIDNRLIGTTGVIELGVPGGPLLRLRRDGASAWEEIDTGGEDLHADVSIERGIADLIDALLQGREPELSARRALQATEIIFALYESSRRRSVVRLPLTILDHPLRCMMHEAT